MLTSFPASPGVARTGPELLSGEVGGVGGEGVVAGYGLSSYVVSGRSVSWGSCHCNPVAAMVYGSVPIPRWSFL